MDVHEEKLATTCAKLGAALKDPRNPKKFMSEICRAVDGTPGPRPQSGPPKSQSNGPVQPLTAYHRLLIFFFFSTDHGTCACSQRIRQVNLNLTDDLLAYS